MAKKTVQKAKVSLTISNETLAIIDATAHNENRSRSAQIDFFLSKAVARNQTIKAK